MRIAVPGVVPELFHQFRGGISQMHRHRSRTVFLNEGSNGIKGRVYGIALGGDGHVDHGLSNSKFPFRATESLVDISSI